MPQMLNKDAFYRNPLDNSLENDGVSKVDNVAVLPYELATFVCEGEYERGLDRILTSYLSHLTRATQPSAWVSGFYGSGKSHMVKTLEALWRNEAFTDGRHPRDIVNLPDHITEQLRELSAEAKRAGGVWSASGMMTESANKSVRMLILGIVYKAAGLSSNYGRARFRLWLRENGWEADTLRMIEAAGRDPEHEFDQYLVSPYVRKAITELTGMSEGEARDLRKDLAAQFNRDDISIDEMEMSLKQVLRAQSDNGKQILLTLIVLDETQQYIGENGERAQALQEAVERIQSSFESKVLVVATGQASLTGTANLQKLQGRFTVNVMLSDKDVEHVVREVVLRKDPTRIGDVATVIKSVEGEIDRHLHSSKIAPRAEDKDFLVSDYPLLPTRNRFWANLLHQLDPTGTSGQLRTQLRVVHGANVHVADKPLGHVIPADFIYNQLQSGLQQSGALPREVSNMINDQEDGTEEGRLRARLIQLIFLIEKLPTEDLSDIELKATPDNLADLLVEDLKLGSTDLRRRIPDILQGLEDDGKLMRHGDGSYSIQTGETLKWQQHFQRERQGLISNPGPLGEIRSSTLERQFRDQVKTTRRVHGESRTPRDVTFHFSNDTPEIASGHSSVIVWIRDGWNNSIKTVLQDARAGGSDDPVIYVFIPQRNQQDVQTALANYEAAKRTYEFMGADSSDGLQAAAAMQNRMLENQRRFEGFLRSIVADADVYQGGGSPVDGTALPDKINTAVEASLKRLFPKFSDADNPHWGTVFTRATQGNADALKAIGHPGDNLDHPVVRDVRNAIPSGAGKSWANVRKQFTNAPYGWPQDAVDGAIAVLVNAEAANATRNGKEIRGKDLSRQQANATQLISEEVTPTPMERIAARKPFVLLGEVIPSDEYVRAEVRNLVERLIELARQAGGEPPAPMSQVPAYLTEMRNQTGNQLVKSIAASLKQLEQDVPVWRQQAEEIERRLKTWETVEQLARHAMNLDGIQAIQDKIEAIRANRQLLATPDPVTSVAQDLGSLLRSETRCKMERHQEVLDDRLAWLKGTEEWGQLDPYRQDGFLAKSSMRHLETPPVSSDRELLAALDKRPLTQLDALIDALPARIDNVHIEMVQELQPRVVTVSLEKPLLKNPADVHRWVNATRDALLRHINDGHPVKIS